jgi:hypothetical protein
VIGVHTTEGEGGESGQILLDVLYLAYPDGTAGQHAEAAVPRRRVQVMRRTAWRQAPSLCGQWWPACLRWWEQLVVAVLFGIAGVQSRVILQLQPLGPAEKGRVPVGVLTAAGGSPGVVPPGVPAVVTEQQGH